MIRPTILLLLAVKFSLSRCLATIREYTCRHTERWFRHPETERKQYPSTDPKHAKSLPPLPDTPYSGKGSRCRCDGGVQSHCYTKGPVPSFFTLCPSSEYTLCRAWGGGVRPSGHSAVGNVLQPRNSFRNKAHRTYVSSVSLL
jgi:hypothetical protein